MSLPFSTQSDYFFPWIKFIGFKCTYFCLHLWCKVSVQLTIKQRPNEKYFKCVYDFKKENCNDNFLFIMQLVGLKQNKIEKSVYFTFAKWISQQKYENDGDDVGLSTRGIWRMSKKENPRESLRIENYRSKHNTYRLMSLYVLCRLMQTLLKLFLYFIFF